MSDLVDYELYSNGIRFRWKISGVGYAKLRGSFAWFYKVFLRFCNWIKSTFEDPELSPKQNKRLLSHYLITLSGDDYIIFV